MDSKDVKKKKAGKFFSVEIRYINGYCSHPALITGKGETDYEDIKDGNVYEIKRGGKKILCVASLTDFGDKDEFETRLRGHFVSINDTKLQYKAEGGILARKNEEQTEIIKTEKEITDIEEEIKNIQQKISEFAEKKKQLLSKLEVLRLKKSFLSLD